MPKKHNLIKSAQMQAKDKMEIPVRIPPLQNKPITEQFIVAALMGLVENDKVEGNKPILV